MLTRGVVRTFRWFAWAALRYIATCVVPVYALLLVLAAFSPDGRDADGFSQNGPEGYYAILLMISVTITVPALISILLVAFPAAKGRDVRGVVALLLALPPALYLLAGAWPFLLMSLLGVVYAGLIMPAAAPEVLKPEAEGK